MGKTDEYTEARSIERRLAKLDEGEALEIKNAPDSIRQRYAKLRKKITDAASPEAMALVMAKRRTQQPLNLTAADLTAANVSVSSKGSLDVDMSGFDE